MRVWIDIENPPQVQYLLPFKRAFEAAGIDVTVTARDDGATLGLLRSAGVDFHPVGAGFGKGKVRKVIGLIGRTRRLLSFFRRRPKPDAVVHAGRAAAIVARRMRIPSFSLWDYEHADMTIDRLTGSYVVFPDAIEAEVFRRKGIRAERLIPFNGLKEDFSFAGVDLDAVAPHSFAELGDDELVRALFRPPAEESHYYRSESGRLTTELLAYLAPQERAVVVFAPRYPWQAGQLRGLPWSNPPIVLESPVPFVSLLKAVDLVVSSGGTMIREAAYLGIPAYSIFRGEAGGVDRQLESQGRIRFISSANDFGHIRLEKAMPVRPTSRNPDLLPQLVQTMLAKAGRASS